MLSNVILMNGKKFMWDGVDYPSGEKTSEAMKKYKADGFEVEQCEEAGKTYLYTEEALKKLLSRTLRVSIGQPHSHGD